MPDVAGLDLERAGSTAAAPDEQWPVVSTRGHQHLHRRHRSPVRQVGGGGRAARPAVPPRRPGGRLPTHRARRRAGRAGPDAPVAASRQPDGRAGLRGDLRRPARLARAGDGRHRRPVPRHRASDHDVVLVVGSDFTDVSAPTEFSVNAAVAANLGSRLLLVVPAQGHDPAEVATAAEMAVAAAREAHAHVTGVVANQVDPDLLEATPSAVAARVHVPVQALPETPLLRAPTVKDLHGRLRRATGARRPRMARPRVHGSGGRGDDDAPRPRPAHRRRGRDRARATARTWCSASCSRTARKTFPTLSGIVLNGGFPLPPQVQRLIEGLDVVLPIIATDGGHHDHRDAGSEPHEAGSRRSPRASSRPPSPWWSAGSMPRHCSARSPRPARAPSTPLMFEHRLVERRPGGRTPTSCCPRVPRTASCSRPTPSWRGGSPRSRCSVTEETIRANAARLGVDISGAAIVDPATSTLREASRPTTPRCGRTRASPSTRPATAWSTPPTSAR